MSSRSDKPLPKKLTKPRGTSKGGLAGLGGLFFLGEQERLDRECLNLLLQHYGIDANSPERWYQLSLTLARERFSGFREETRGRSTVWSEEAEAELYLRAWILAEQECGGSKRKACQMLSEEGQYSTFTRDNLHHRLMIAQKKNPIVCRWIDEQQQAKRKAIANALRGCEEKKS